MIDILKSLLTVYINVFSAMVYADTYSDTESTK
jgi:hypothetical protein